MTIMQLPFPLGLSTGLTAQDSGTTLDASGEYVGNVLRVTASGTIDAVVINLSLFVTGSDSVDVRIETVDPATGLPSGTLFGTNTNAIYATTINGYVTVTLTAGAAVTAGDLIAVVLRWVAGSFSVLGTRPQLLSGFPYRVVNTGTPSKINSAELTCAALRYSDGSFSFVPGVPQWDLEHTVFNSASTPDELGNLFTLNRAYSGVGVWGYVGANLNDFEIVVYSGSTVLRTITIDKDTFSFTATGYFIIPCAAFALEANTNYRLVYKPGGSNLTVVRMSGYAAAVRAAMPGGSAWQATSRADAGSWTETTTEQVSIGLLVDDSAATGGGGVSRSRVVNQ